MTESEESALRGVYEQWPLERLARAATIEKGDYRPEAVEVMLDVLKNRGVGDETLPVLSTVPPTMVSPSERDTRFLPARLNRKQYAIRWLPWFVTTIAIAALLELAPAIQPEAAIGWVLGALVYKIIGLDVPRLRNAGLSPWLLLSFLVPLANLAMFILLFAAPPKK